MSTSTLAAQTDAIHVTVLDPDGNPCKGAKVEVWRYPGHDAGYNNLDIVDRRRAHRVVRMSTGRRGTTAVHLPVGIPYRIHVDVPPFAIEDVRWVYADSEVVVKLHEAGAVRGTILRDDNVPMVGAKIEMRRTDGASRLYATTDQEGRFQFERVGPAGRVIEVDAPEGSIPKWTDVLVKPGEVSDIEIVLAKGAELVGHVRDVDTGKPIAGAEVAICWVFDKVVRTAEDGSYRMQGIGGPYGNDLYARALGHATRRIDRPEVVAGQLRLDIELHRGESFIGRVVDANGAPVEDCYVAIVRNGTDWRSAYTDADGRYRLDGVRLVESSSLFVRHERFAWRILALPEAKPGSPRRLPVIEMQPRRILEGRLMDGSEPLANARVKLRGCNRDAPDTVVGNLTTRLVRSASDGRFFFGNLAAGKYVVEADGEEYEVEVRPDKDPAPIVLGR